MTLWVKYRDVAGGAQHTCSQDGPAVILWFPWQSIRDPPPLAHDKELTSPVAKVEQGKNWLDTTFQPRPLTTPPTMPLTSESAILHALTPVQPGHLSLPGTAQDRRGRLGCALRMQHKRTGVG